MKIYLALIILILNSCSHQQRKIASDEESLIVSTKMEIIRDNQNSKIFYVHNPEIDNYRIAKGNFTFIPQVCEYIGIGQTINIIETKVYSLKQYPLFLQPMPLLPSEYYPMIRLNNLIMKTNFTLIHRPYGEQSKNSALNQIELIEQVKCQDV